MVLAVILAAWLASCANAPPARPTAAPDQPPAVTPLPVTVVPAITSPLPLPATDLGAVIGQVFDLAGARPVSNTPVYLGQVFRTADGSGVFALEPNTSPKGMTDAEGRFIIKDVPPGEYVLAVGAIGSVRVPSVVMSSPTEVKAFAVQPGVVTNLGAMRVDYLDR